MILDRLAEEPGDRYAIRIVHGVERPEGWVGKTWAVHQGATGSTAEWLWFVDADMGLHPRALASAMAGAIAEKADFVSLLPGVRCQTFWQGAIASTLVQLLGQLYPLDRVNDPTRPEAIAAGGFILVRRSTYSMAGGHEGVRRAIVEDIQLARAVKATGGKLLVRLAPKLAWTHMYGSFGQIWKGLRKNAYAGMDYLPHKYVTGAIVALLLAWAPWVVLAIGPDEFRPSQDRCRSLGHPGPGIGLGADADLPRPALLVRADPAGRNHGVRRHCLEQRLASPPRADLVERPHDLLKHRREPSLDRWRNIAIIYWGKLGTAPTRSTPIPSRLVATFAWRLAGAARRVRGRARAAFLRSRNFNIWL